jgi:hypothetical protein
METLVKITNEKLYNEKVIDVDTSGLSSTDYYNGRYGNFCASGHISIELENGEWIESTGEHGSKDYEEDYGFVLECKDEE